jgi:hypothetical protein
VAGDSGRRGLVQSSRFRAAPRHPIHHAVAAGAHGAWSVADNPHGEGQPSTFQAISWFAAGGAFITTGSDEAGTGLGEWTASGTKGLAFTYLNFHFGQDGKLSNRVKVRAKRTFKSSALTGRATLTVSDSSGKPISPAAYFTFKGKRIAVEAP